MHAWGQIQYHPGFRHLRCSASLRGNFVVRRSDRTDWFELYNTNPDDAAELMAFVAREFPHLLTDALPARAAR